MGDQGEEVQPHRTISECPVCYVSYDNGPKTPLLLSCGHTFCMECLSRMCIFTKQTDTFSCPLCRAAISIPAGGIPKLSANLEMMSSFPPGLQDLQTVWLEGSRLCWLKKNGSEDLGMVVTLQLLPHPEHPYPPHMVGVHHPPRLSRYRIWFTNYLGVGFLMLASLLFVFSIIFIPAYLIRVL
uniref:RING-type domain-containing protein n=1 Tax=Callorhinchus milii TaxID=7868 RepID=A0A4W3JVJ9_CALMI